jgi:hypothetical protein
MKSSRIIFSGNLRTELLFQSILLLPEAQQQQVACFTVEKLVESIREQVRKAQDLKKLTPPKYVGAAKEYQNACLLIDNLLKFDDHFRKDVDKCELSAVYAEYALSLKKHAPHLGAKEEVIKKCLALDPSNVIANGLKLDLEFDAFFLGQKVERHPS